MTQGGVSMEFHEDFTCRIGWVTDRKLAYSGRIGRAGQSPMRIIEPQRREERNRKG